MSEGPGIAAKTRRAVGAGGPTVFAAHVLRYLGDELLARAATRAFRGRRADVRDIPTALDLAFEFDFEGVSIAPMQIRSEIERLLAEVERRRPRTVLEIGSAQGGTLFLFTQVAAPDALLISVDLPGGGFGGGYPAARARLYESFAREGQTIELLRGDSHTAETRDRVTALLGGRPVDFLFIDGDHTKKGVETDFNMYSELVAPGGAIALHDIVPGSEVLVGGVPEFWQELRAGREVEEFVEDWEQGAYGIGFIPQT
jgi:predicted O-methyltransferase YrrM